MKSKLNYLISLSLKRKIKTKWFLIANIILLIIIAGIINIDTIINLFGGDFNKDTPIYVIDNTNCSYQLLEGNIKESINTYNTVNYDISLYEDNIDKAKELLEDNENIIVIELNSDPINTLSATILTSGYIDMIDYQMLISSINNTKINLAINNSDIPIEKFNLIYKDAEINRIILDENKTTEEESTSMIITTVFPAIILPIFILTIFLVQMIGAEVNDEKATKSMEIIISNVSPNTHFFAKVIAGNLFVFMQSFLIILYSLFGIVLRNFLGSSLTNNGVIEQLKSTVLNAISSGIGDKLIYIIPLTIILMILTFLAYSLLAGILASMTTNTEDFQQMQTPIMILSITGYYLSVMAGVFKGSLFIKIFSYIPFISAILSPSLLLFGQIGIIDLLISLILLIIVIYLLIKYGLKIYKVGILNYSSKNLWKKFFNAIRK